MKSPTLLAVALGVAVSGASLSFSSAIAAPPPGDPETTCDLERSLAVNFMSMRQQGVEKEAVISNMEEEMGEIDEHSQRIIDAAYEEPVDDENPAQAAEEFAEAQHARCVENYAGT